MKKGNKIWLSVLLMLPFGMLTAQSLVATDPLPRNVILEEFSGIHCGYCPAASALAQELIDEYPNRLAVITLHQGAFAEPNGDEPDYRTVWGDSIAELAGVYAYPMGTVNRHLFSGDITAMNTASWNISARQVMEDISPVNVGVQTAYDSLSRELTIHVELYYTGSSPLDVNLLNIALIQSHIFGPQLGGSGDEYEHMYMLRDLITGQWGDPISPTTEGSFIEKDFMYVVPQAINEIPVIVEDCEIVVFVSETKNDIYTGDVVPALNGNNRYIGNVNLTDTVQMKKGVEGDSTEFIIATKSALTGEEEFLITVEAFNIPDDWRFTCALGDLEFTDTAMVMLSHNAEEQIRCAVVPGPTAAFASFVISLQSVAYPDAPYRYCEFHVVSGITDLVVNGTGGKNSETYDYVFSDGLKNAGSTSYAVMTADEFETGLYDRALEDVKNVYLNIAWTFPALTVSQIETLKRFMDEGGNLLISGQDIGWDFMSGSANAHPSPEAADFYTNYLLSEYLADGSAADYIIYANPQDDVYGKTPDAFLIDIYNGNFYPDNIAARQGADEIFYYESNNRAAAVKAEVQNRKMVYFAMGLEMVGQAFVTDKIIGLTYYWFNNTLSTEEYGAEMAGIFAGQNHPNPACSETFIPLKIDADGYLDVYRIDGKMILSVPLEAGKKEIMLDVSDWTPGIYLYRVRLGANTGIPVKLVVR